MQQNLSCKDLNLLNVTKIKRALIKKLNIIYVKSENWSFKAKEVKILIITLWKIYIPKIIIFQ